VDTDAKYGRVLWMDKDQTLSVWDGSERTNWIILEFCALGCQMICECSSQRFNVGLSALQSKLSPRKFHGEISRETGNTG
jgi:hypothetical protein